MAVDPIVIVGAGPAGMMLAYQLAANGVAVRVLERHRDFEREFRGEFIQPSVVRVLDALGIIDELHRRNGVQPIRAVRMHLGLRPFATNVGPDGRPAGLAVHQPTLLGLLHEQCSRFPGYRLDFGARVESFVRENDRVRGVIARIGASDERIDGRLVVVCNGRNSSLRKDLGTEVDELEAPYSVLWLRFDVSGSPSLYPDTLDGFITRRAFCVLYPTYGRRVQLMWRRARSHPLDWKSPIEVLRSELLTDTPAHWHPIFDSLTKETERQVLRVVCDRLRRWWSPGALFLGDAAHTMSPVGGQGVSVAVRDAIVAANHILERGREGTIEDAMLAAIEGERRFEIEKAQAFQSRAGRIGDAPPVAQWIMANLVVPLATRLQGASYLRNVQDGFTDVTMKFPVATSFT
jgi:2-polyprenyl-6-methoxyphenol hydroxylase-like FAD-dependent oxidoreductase